MAITKDRTITMSSIRTLTVIIDHLLPENRLFRRAQLIITGREEIVDDLPLTLDTEIPDLLQSIPHQKDVHYLG